MIYEKLSNLKVNPDNPRTIKDENFKKLVTSIKNFPEMLKIRPLVVNENNIVLGGNMRRDACIAAGLEEVPIIKINLSSEQEKEFIIKDNLSYGEWDFPKLKQYFDTTLLSDWGITLPTELKELTSETPKYETKFEVVADCINESEQERVYELLTSRGYKCRVLTV